MREAVIVSAVRTAIGRAPNGTLRNARPEYLCSEVIKEAINRAAGLKPEDIEDVVIGSSFPEAEAGLNLGRIVALKAGLPFTVPGQTVNRFCASGLEAIAIACQKIMAGQLEVAVAGGVETMSTIPMGGNKLSPDPDLVINLPNAYINMGMTAENVAQKFNVSRKDQDEFAFGSHQKAIKALRDKKFEKQILPIKLSEGAFINGKAVKNEVVFNTDECVRSDITLEGLANLKPLFHIKGTVTAGNACPINDGASAVVIMSRDKAKTLGLKPIGIFRAYAAGGVEPELMGIGPVVAVPKALKFAGIQLSQLDLIELNEAFASQALYVIRTLGMDINKVNVNGGGIALGHPLGCTGSYLTTKLLYELEQRKARYGLVTMCVGGGMGAAGIFEREN
jgi:acetyl-CoA acyltransferase